jgi:hypothetical protein
MSTALAEDLETAKDVEQGRIHAAIHKLSAGKQNTGNKRHDAGQSAGLDTGRETSNGGIALLQGHGLLRLVGCTYGSNRVIHSIFRLAQLQY